MRCIKHQRGLFHPRSKTSTIVPTQPATRVEIPIFEMRRPVPATGANFIVHILSLCPLGG
jgi:hypothetical protein